MNYETIFNLILDLGRELIRCGGETHRVEDTLYRLAAGYHFQSCSIWVVPSEIQATFTDPEGVTRTQIRHVKGIGLNFDTLDRLNALSRWACTESPEPSSFAARLDEIRTAAPLRPWLAYLGGVLGGWGFSLFFGCDLLNSLIAALASLLVCWLVRQLSPREGNPLILNFAVSLITQFLIVLAVWIGPTSQLQTITISVVMLLISGLGAFNGLRDLVHLDTLSGLINITASFTGAFGIALGMALPLLIFREVGGTEAAEPRLLVQVIACGVSGLGFSIWFRVRGRKIAYCAAGAFLTWGVYLLSYHAYPSAFGATMLASVFCGFYGQIMARVNKSPATIFTTICILPLLPGSSLYYAMHGVVIRNAGVIYDRLVELGMICFGIVLGFMVVEVANRFVWRRSR